MGRWTTVDQDVRESLGLTMNEYGIADSIYHLSKKDGWCESSKAYLGEFIGISRRSTIKIIDKLIMKKLIERDASGKRLRTTEFWDSAVLKTKQTVPESNPLSENDAENATPDSENDAQGCELSSHLEDKNPSEGVKKVHTPCEESSHPGVKKVHTKCEESSHNNNNIYTDNNINNIADGSVIKNPEIYFHKNLIATFFAGYKSIYKEKLIFSKKETGCIQNIIRDKILKYESFVEQKSITQRKINLLREIAERRNPYQNWQFLPSQLILHWDQLVDGCIQGKKKKNDPDKQREYYQQLEKEMEATNA